MGSDPPLPAHSAGLDPAELRPEERAFVQEHCLKKPLRALDIWAAPGEGQSCDACGEPIAKNQQIVCGIAAKDWMSVQFHAHCYELWEAERLALSRKDGTGYGGQS